MNLSRVILCYAAALTLAVAQFAIFAALFGGDA